MHSFRGPDQNAATAVETPPRVHVIDDDRAVRIALVRMLSDLGFDARPFGTASDLLDTLDTLPPGVLLIEFQLGDGTGLELLEQLRRSDCYWPAAIMTGHGDVALAVQAMKAGAVDFIEKPFEKAVLLTALEEGFRRLDRAEVTGDRVRDAATRLQALTPREREVLDGLARGLPNKTVAYELGISARTVEIHRANVMTKLGARSFSQALRVAFAAQGD